jgi:hypothetical protein
MADLTITAANVDKGASATVLDVTWGATVTAGDAVYKDTADSDEWKPAVNSAAASSGGSTGAVNSVGIALNGGADGQPGQVMLRGANLDLGATLTVGESYFVSSTAGAIHPDADLVSNDFVTYLGTAATASQLVLSPVITGAQVP